MAKEIELIESDLYQNGQPWALDGGKSVLLRERLPVGGNVGDATAKTIPEQDIRLLAFNQWKGLVRGADNWWWLIADTNGIFHPLANLAFDAEGNEFNVMTKPVLIPNILRRKTTI